MSRVDAPPDLLATIVAATRQSVATREHRYPADALRASTPRSPDGAQFHAALASPDTVNVIAECKRRSPSAGLLCADYDPARIAAGYAAHGAAAISVLTEPTFFDGSLDHLSAVRAAVDLPILRKDFIVTPYQLLEAAAAGADAVLLIVAALDDTDLATLHAEATTLGLAVLVEVHDDAELERAVRVGARIIGVNNRNLRTLTVDLGASRRLVGRMPAGVVSVAESGLKTGADLAALGAVGYRAFLVGEALVGTPDPGAALGRLLDASQSTTAAVPERAVKVGGA